MRVAARLIGDEQEPSGSDVGVATGQIGLIERSKVIKYRELSPAERHLDDAVSPLCSRNVAGIKCAVSSGKVYIPCGIRRQPGTRHPHTAKAAVSCGVKHAFLSKCGGIISEYPSVVGAEVTVGRECHINCAIRQQNPRPTMLHQGIKGELATGAPVTGSIDRRRDDDRAGRFFGARGDVKGMQAMDVVSAFI